MLPRIHVAQCHGTAIVCEKVIGFLEFAKLNLGLTDVTDGSPLQAFPLEERMIISCFEPNYLSDDRYIIARRQLCRLRGLSRVGSERFYDNARAVLPE